VEFTVKPASKFFYCAHVEAACAARPMLPNERDSAGLDFHVTNVDAGA